MKKSFSVMVAIVLIASMSVLAFAACETECEHKNRQHFEAVEATCAKDGNVEYWYCPDCGEYLDSYNSVLTQEELVVKATGEHEFVDGVCSVCGANEAPGEGLSFQLNSDGTSYSVSGIGSATSKDIVIPATHNGLPVTSIEQQAFSNCSGLTSITIPDSVTSIDWGAFEDCSGLTSVMIPDSVTSIGAYAFDGCSGLTDVHYQGDLSGWSEIEFSREHANPMYYVDNLYINGELLQGDIVIPDGTKKIGDYAFYNCDALTSVTISDSVTSIGYDAFRGCSGLTSITIGNGVISIGSNAFSGCSNLTGICIPDSVTGIGRSAFSGCSSLTSITIPFVGEEADGSGETHFGYIFGGQESYDAYRYVPESLKEVIITGGESIGDGAFRGCGSLTSVTIPASVTSIGSAAFRYCSDLTSVTIPDGVTSIGGYAFDGCGGLTSVTIPDSVTSIGNYAFSECRGLTSVTIPDSVTRIGNDAFLGCRGLTNMTIPFVGGRAAGTGETYFGYIFGASDYSGNEYYVPETLKEVIITGGTNIDGRAFYGCSGLTSITISDSVTSIGSSAFQGCSGLTSVTIPDSVTSIGDSAFYECSGLTSVTIPDGVTSIGEYAFGYCSGLTSVTIPDSVTSIGEYAFGYCSGLTSVTIPDSVRSIGDYAFYRCYGLTSITIPDSVTSIGEYAFGYCSGLTSVTIPDSVTSIGSYAFYWCSGLTSVTIGSGVTSIGEYAFDYCSGLTDVYYQGDLSGWLEIEFGGYDANPMGYVDNCYINGELLQGDIVIPDGTEKIEAYAFYRSGLTSVTIPDSVTRIGNYAFSSSALTRVTIGDGVTSIGEDAFYACSWLTSVTIGSGVTSIGESAFRYCYNLKDVYYQGDLSGWAEIEFDDGTLMSANNIYINEELLQGDIVIPDGTEKIGANAFGGNRDLTSVIIPDGVTSIGEDAFSWCSGLTNISIPNSVTSIGYGAFSECTSLQFNSYDGAKYLGNDSNPYLVLYDVTYTGVSSFEIMAQTKIIYDNAFSGCSSLTSIVIPDSVTSIGRYAFDGCSGLTSVTIGGGVTSIGYSSFSGCSGLTSVTIPDSVTSVGERAFYGCSGLTSVTIASGVTSIGEDAFYGCSGLTSITIPDSVTSIGLGAFEDCSGLTSITIPFVGERADGTGATNFGYIFGTSYYDNNERCVPSSLKEVIITGGASIAKHAFSDCRGLTRITIPDSVTSIGEDAFEYCDGLTDVYYQGDLSGWSEIEFADLVGNPMFYAENLYINEELLQGDIFIPDGTAKIGDYSFYMCGGLTSVTIPDSVTNIGYDAFWGCDGLISVTIGEGVTSIGSYAFSGCSGLTTINFQGTIAQWRAIEKGNGWDNRTGTFTVICTDGYIS